MKKDKCSEKCTAKPETTVDCMYYSKVLKEPFNTMAELAEAEEAYYAKLKEKEERATQKKAEAQKVEDAFKALNTARKTYKEEITALTKEYAGALETLKKSFELGQKDIKEKLANAEETYSKALKEFSARYPEGFHITLKDGDFETTISSKNSINPDTKRDSSTKRDPNLMSLWDFFFNF